MKCDLCGEEMMRLRTSNGSEPKEIYACISWTTVEKDCAVIHIDENGEPEQYNYRGTFYTSEEWKRLLKLKWFL